MRYSYSRLHLYEQCPRAWRCRYIDERPSTEPAAWKLGSEVHRWIADYIKHCAATGRKTDLTWMGTVSASPEALIILDIYARSHYLEDIPVRDIERTITAEIDGCPWISIIDLLETDDTDATVIDHKTDYHVRSQAEIDRDLQLKSYAWAVMRHWPEIDHVRCVMDFVRHAVQRDVHYTRDDMPAIEAELSRRIEVIEADVEYRPTPGSFCSWCSWTADCPAILEDGPELILDASDALIAAERLIAYEAEVKRLKGLIGTWCSENGPIQTNGVEVGHFLTRSIRYPDSHALYAALCNAGVDPLKYMTADTTLINRQIKRDPGLAELMEPLGADSSYSRFTIRRIKV